MQRLPLLVPRPRAQGEAFASRLEAAVPGMWAPIIAPLIEIVPVAASFELARAVPIFSSIHGVLNAGISPSAPAALCVGEATARAAVEAGFTVRRVAPTSDDLVAATAPETPGAFLHVRGVHSRGDIAARLRGAGHDVREAVVYDQEERLIPTDVMAGLRGGRIRAAALFSPRTARLFASQIAGTPGLTLYCLSPAVANAVSTLPTVDIRVAARPDADAMIERLRSLPAPL
ncbi:MAG: uroporphyrinogen-III synthase [Pseudomonadota bacterium]